MIIRTVTFVSLFLLAKCLLAQEEFKPRLSPLAIIGIRYKDNYVKITYSQPQKKSREIFGNLVPYGKVWRTGANEATEITVTRDIQIDSIILKAGTYSIFTIPDKHQWTIIINSDVGLWGAYNYNEQKNIWRFTVPVQPSDRKYEYFTMTFDHRNEVADLLIMWDRTKVAVPIKFIN